MEKTYLNHLKAMIELGKKLFSHHTNLTKKTGQTNTKGDATIEMDALIETTFIEYVQKQKLPFKIYSEEIGIVDTHPNPTHLLCFDPLDGSTNYTVGKNLFPYGMLLCLFSSLEPKISDVVVSAAHEVTNDLTFYFDGTQTYGKNGKLVKIKKDWIIDKSTPIYLDLHRRSYYDSYHNIAEKLYIRNSGSTIGNLVYTLKNTTCGMGHPRIKAEEIGAVYSLIKGAGGICINHSGDDLGNENFSVNDNYHLLAGCKKTIEFAAKMTTP